MNPIQIATLAIFVSLVGTRCYGQVAQSPANLPEPIPTVVHHGWANLVAGQMDGTAVVIAEDGTAKPVPGALVTLLKGAEEVGTATADVDGNFALVGLTPGPYGLLVESEGVFAAHSFQARDGEVTSPVEVYVSSLPRAEVEAIWQSLWVPDPPLMDASSKLGLPVVAAQSPSVRMHNGVVRGRVVFEYPTVTPSLHFVKVYGQSGNLIATEQVRESGEFSVALPGPGIYNFIIGGQAYACISARIVDAAGIAKIHKLKTRLVSHSIPQDAADELVISAICPVSAGTIVEEIPPAELGPGGLPMFSSPTPMGGFGGGGSGGGFGGGFGGGLGGLLGIAGLAAGVVALSDDDDGFTAPPATPIAN